MLRAPGLQGLVISTSLISFAGTAPGARAPPEDREMFDAERPGAMPYESAARTLANAAGFEHDDEGGCSSSDREKEMRK